LEEWSNVAAVGAAPRKDIHVRVGRRSAPSTETVITADLDPAYLRKVRRQVPSLANRLPDRYAWPEAARELAEATAD